MMKFKKLLGQFASGIALVVVSTNLLAGAVAFTNEHLGDSGSCPNPNVSNPINIATGNKFHHELVYADTGNFPLNFSWDYNSRAKGKDDQFRGVWTHSYGEYGVLSNNAGGYLSKLELVRADGSHQTFTYDESIKIDANNYFSESGFPTAVGDYLVELDELNSSKGTYNLPNSRSTHKVMVNQRCILDVKKNIRCAYIGLEELTIKRFPSGFVEKYNLLKNQQNSFYHAKIKSIESPTGETHTISYATVNELNVTHSNGRSLMISLAEPTVSPHHPYINIQYPNSLTVGGLVWNFNDNKASAANHPHSLQLIYRRDQNNVVHNYAQFHYDTPFDKGDVQEAGYDWGTQLLGYSKNNQRVAGWRYDSKGRAIMAFHQSEDFDSRNSFDPTENMVLADQISNLDHHDLRTYTNRYGKSTTYGYQKVEGEVKLISISGNATTNCGASNSSYTYYESGENHGQLKNVTDAEGYIKEFSYESIGRKSTVIYAKGTNEEYNIVYGWGDVGTDEYITNQELGLIQSVAAPGLTTEYEYYDNNRIEQITRTDTSNTRDSGKKRYLNFVYDYKSGSNERVLSKLTVNGTLVVTGVNANDKTELSYDNSEHLTEIKRYLNTNVYISTTFSNYNEWGQPQQIVDENGVTTVFEYETLSNNSKVSSVTVGSANPITYEYATNLNGVFSNSPWEMPTRIIYPDNSWVRIHYSADNYQDIDYIENNLGEKTQYSYNRESSGVADDKLTITKTIKRMIDGQETDVYVSTKVIDALGRLFKTNNTATSAEFNYDLNSNVSAIKQLGEHLNNNGNLSIDSIMTSNGLNQSTDIVSPDSGNTNNGFDENGQLSKVTDAIERETDYIKNGFGEVLRKTSPDTGITDYYYDASGNIEREIKNVGGAQQQEIIYDFDLLNRLKSVAYTGSLEKIEYTYDENPNTSVTTNAYGIGRLTKVENKEATSEFYYSESGALVKTRVLYKELNDIYITDYKINSQTLVLEEITYPSGLIIVYGRNALNQVTSISYKYSQTDSVTNFITNISYWPMGPIETITYANGTEQTFTLDTAYRTTQISVSDGLMLLDYKDFDDFGNLTERDWSTKNNPLVNQNYTYDMASRLETVNDKDFNYNTIGDRTQFFDGAETFTYDYTTNGSGLPRIEITETGFYRDFDELGNLSSDSNGFSYNYNLENRLSNIINGGADIANYGYDAFGQRIRKENINGSTYFIYGQNGELLAETDGNDWQDYIFIGGRLVGRVDKSTGWSGVYSNGATAPTVYENGDDLIIDSDQVGSADYFAYQTVNGNTSLTAEISSLLGSTTGTDAGVEIRASSSSNANFARITLHGTRQIILIHGDIIIPIVLPQEDVLKLTYKDSTGTHEVEYSVDGHTHFKVERTNAGVILSTSSNGVSWTQRGATLNLGLSSTALIGFRVAGIVEDVVFENVESGSGVVTQSKAYSIYTDHLATPIVIADQNKNVVWDAEYSAFGEVTLITNSIENNIRFPGQYFDSETSFHYNMMRYYDPSSGRYITSDPIGLTGGINTYAYVNGNPINSIDPSGLFGIAFHCMHHPADCDAAGLTRPGTSNPCAANEFLSGVGDAIVDALINLAPIPRLQVLTRLRLPGRRGRGRNNHNSPNSPCPLSCFVAGTQVLTDEGYTGIENIQVGDVVWAKDIENGKSEWKEVTNTWIVENREIYQVVLATIDDQIQTIDSTSDHPFYVVGKGWIETIDLTAGDLVEVKEGEPIVVQAVVKQYRKNTAYNFTVDDFHTYYITERNVFVHNCTPRDPNSIELSHPANLSTPFSPPRNDQTVGQLAQNLLNNPDLANRIPAIEIVKIKGVTYSANNRRLRAFQEAGIDINTIPASKEQVRKIKARLRNKR